MGDRAQPRQRIPLKAGEPCPGVHGDVRRSLFQPGVTTKQGGWGIGLALTQRVVEDAHGGNLSLEPTDAGASFLIELPLHDS